MTLKMTTERARSGLRSTKRGKGVSTTSEHSQKKVKANIESKTQAGSIQDLADAVIASSRNYNNIVELLKLAQHDQSVHYAARSALCRLFCHLLFSGRMTRRSASTNENKLVVTWLWQRYSEYKQALLGDLPSCHTESVHICLSLVMQTVQADAEASPESVGAVWRQGTFFELINMLITEGDADRAWKLFVTTYVCKYPDIRLYTLQALCLLLNASSGMEREIMVDRAVLMLRDVDNTDSSASTESASSNLLPQHDKKLKEDGTRKKIAGVWLAILRGPLVQRHRRTILDMVPSHIAPKLSKPEMLLDFLTDCCDLGGSDRLMALAGLHHLIQHRGLDYPLIYHKLYAALDANSLHKRRRSQLLRLVSSFLASTHLPAVLVASFVKRMSRLCLYTPPAVTVAIVPLVYNLMQNHPACTHMLHRVHNQNRDARPDPDQVLDPFDPDGADPNSSGAIGSSLWELDTLKDHWHPNVSTIAKILAEQFLKQSYKLEDFLDHSYQSLMDAELAKSVIKQPAIEFHIPKHIFTKSGQTNMGHDMMSSLWDFEEQRA